MRKIPFCKSQLSDELHGRSYHGPDTSGAESASIDGFGGSEMGDTTCSALTNALPAYFSGTHVFWECLRLVWSLDPMIPWRFGR